MKDRQAVAIVKAALQAQRSIIDSFIDDTGKPPTSDDIYLLMPLFVASFVLQFDDASTQKRAIDWFLHNLTPRTVEAAPIIRELVLSGPYTEVKI